jgi:hypothetical protein
MTIKKLVVVHGGELAQDVAEQIAKKGDSSFIKVSLKSASERPKTLLELNDDTVVCFVMQTIENSQPTEEVGECMLAVLVVIDCLFLETLIHPLMPLLVTLQGRNLCTIFQTKDASPGFIARQVLLYSTGRRRFQSIVGSTNDHGQGLQSSGSRARFTIGDFGRTAALCTGNGR